MTAAARVVERSAEPRDQPHAIVVGSGIAGLTVALHAVDGGCRVTLVTKDVLEHANTRYAQGGIAGVMFADDRAEDHVRDTLAAGAGLCDPEAVRVLVEEGPARIRELIDLGVGFDRTADGDFVKGLEAAHSYPRILHSGGDATGTAIEKALVARLRTSGAEVIEHAFLIDLVVRDGRVAGVELLVGERAGGDPSTRLSTSGEAAYRDTGTATSSGTPMSAVAGHRLTLSADAVVLATGGAGELYAHSTNPAVATADGIAAAIRAGAEVQDLEFFQFHPTVLPGGLGGGAFLVSEAVRGEGATLVDERGRRFAFDAHPDGELAPRDVVARAIAEQMERQDGRPVFLDATGLRPSVDERRGFLAHRFPTIDRAVRDRGLDWVREPIPVTPAAHYLMGGVTADLFGRTTLPGLYAVGEVARTGVHGANRLASNSLLEGAVFGARAGDVIAADAASGVWPVPRAAPAVPAGPRETTLPPRNHAPRDVSSPKWFLEDTPPFSRPALQELMWERAGLVRDEEGLGHAASVLATWRAKAREPRAEAEFEDENLLVVAEQLVAAARARRESVGAHFRQDAAAYRSQDGAAGSAPNDPDPALKRASILRTVHAAAVAAC